MTTVIKGLKVLEKEDFERVCPSFYAEAPKATVSDKYAFISTRAVATQLWDMGWMPVAARESSSRDMSNRGFTKHLVRFAHPDFDMSGERIELALTNSHNTQSALQFMAAIYRQVCSNGLIAHTGDLGNFSVKHFGSIEDQVSGAIAMIAGNAGLIADKIEDFKTIELTPDEQGIFAQAAHSFVYDKADHVPVTAPQLLTHRRLYDKGNSLWTTYNRVQENLMKGGLRGSNSKGKRSKTRAVKSIDKDVKLNKALWSMAEQMASLKAA